MKLTKKMPSTPAFGKASDFPYDLKVEQAVLAALLLDAAAMEEIHGLNLSPAHFFDDRHSQVYEAINRLYEAGKKIDLLTVNKELKRNKAGVEAAYLAEITQNIASSAHLVEHVKELIELSMRRQLMLLAMFLNMEASNEKKDIFDVVNNFVDKAFAVTEIKANTREVKLSEALPEHLKELEEKQRNNGFTGIETGFQQLNTLLGGWLDGDVYILGGRTGMGKTSLLLYFLIKAAEYFRQKGSGNAIFFSCEMSIHQVLNRLISQGSSIIQAKLRDANLSEGEWQKIFQVTNEGKLGDLPLFIDDTPNISMDQLKIKARRLAKKDDLKMIFIDYLQLMRPATDKRFGPPANRTQEVSEISLQLKELARELNVPIVVASQLSRAVENRGTPYLPQLSDLRESGSIEQDASGVILLHRPEYYGITEDEKGNPCNGLANMVVAKNRHGSTGVVTAKFDGALTRFSEYQETEGFVEPEEPKI